VYTMNIQWYLFNHYPVSGSISMKTWHTLLTENDMSGRVNVKALTMLRSGYCPQSQEESHHARIIMQG
jgi:hypothetical protein